MKGLVRRLSFVLMVAAGVMMCLMMLHITADVAMKYALNQPLFGTVEVVSYYYMIGAIYLPLAYVHVRGQHISVDLFFNHFSQWGKRLCDALAHLCAIVLFSILAYQGWLDATKAMEIGEIVMGSTTISIWPSRFMLPVSFALVTVVSVLRFVDEILLGRDPPSSNPPADGVDESAALRTGS